VEFGVIYFRFMEQEKFKEREGTIYLAVLNNEIEKNLATWKLTENPRGTSELNTLIHLAHKAGKGFVVEIGQSAISAAEIRGFTDEAKKYISRGESGSIIFTLPNINERRALHRRVLTVGMNDDYLFLVSSEGDEAYFRRQDVISVEAK